MLQKMRGINAITGLISKKVNFLSRTDDIGPPGAPLLSGVNTDKMRENLIRAAPDVDGATVHERDEFPSYFRGLIVLRIGKRPGHYVQTTVTPGANGR